MSKVPRLIIKRASVRSAVPIIVIKPGIKSIPKRQPRIWAIYGSSKKAFKQTLVGRYYMAKMYPMDPKKVAKKP